MSEPQAKAKTKKVLTNPVYVDGEVIPEGSEVPKGAKVPEKYLMELGAKEDYFALKLEAIDKAKSGR